MKTNSQTTIRTYSELSKITDYLKRFEYLKLGGQVGYETFGFERYLNQQFYRSKEWQRIRDYVITRDSGCDLGCDGYEIHERIYIHHMNPVCVADVRTASDILIDPEYLISTTHNTHNAIHYGDSSLLIADPIERKPHDMCPWIHNERIFRR